MFRFIALSVPLLALPFSALAADGKKDAATAPAVKVAKKAAKKADTKPAAKAKVTKPKVVVPPPKPPKDVPEALGLGKQLLNFIKTGEGRSAVAAALMLLLFLWRRFAAGFVMGKFKDDKFALALIVAITGYLASIPMALTADGFSWLSFIWNGLATSGSAMALWLVIGKQVLPKVFGAIDKGEKKEATTG